MPKPIDHRDVTLTETNRQVPYAHSVEVHFDNLGSADVPSVIKFDRDPNNGSTLDLTEHEVRVKSSSVVIATIFWTREARSGDPLSFPTCSVYGEIRQPPAGAGTTGADTGDTWSPTLASPDNRWAFTLRTKHTAATGYGVTRTRTDGANSVNWTFTVRKLSTGVVLFRGSLNASCDSGSSGPMIAQTSRTSAKSKSKKKKTAKKAATEE